MAIYGQFGDKVTILRVGTLEDVKALDRRKPDKRDRDAVEAGAYVVVKQDDGTERLYHQVYLRADDGLCEIGRAIEALTQTSTAPSGVNPKLSASQLLAMASLATDPAAEVAPATLSKLRKLKLVGKKIGKDDHGRQKTTSPITDAGRAVLAK